MKNKILEDYCSFIHDYMQFYSYKDFMKRRNLITSMYLGMSWEFKQMYKWYVFANQHLNDLQKQNIWNILNCMELEEEDLQDSKMMV